MSSAFPRSHRSTYNEPAMSIAKNLRRVRERMAEACERSERDPQDVTLVAVTKYAPLEAVRELIAEGQLVLAESRPQQLLERAADLTDPRPNWHLIGHLQRNKARKLLPVVDCIHSVDSLRLAETIDRLGEELVIKPRIFIEVNVAGETSKDGFDMIALQAAWPRLERLEHIVIGGLMTMAPYADDAESARPVFRELRALRDRLADGGRWPLPDLSMGMSGDFEVAIEEGATLIRVGHLLFEE